AEIRADLDTAGFGFRREVALVERAATRNMLAYAWAFTPDEAREMVGSGAIRLSVPQLLTIVAGFLIYAGTELFTRYTVLGKQIRAVSSNPFLAEITRLRPRRIYRYVMAIASGMVCVLGILTPLDFGLRPYGGLTQLLIATVAMIAGGIGSVSGAFLVAMGIGILQNLALLVASGDWSVAITFSIFLVFMLFKPTGLFRTS
ncbi:MAG: branched-chain amino acid ABC transporter permease, partial [Mesorhizobium sp.]